jgi:hypothetical protein
MKKILIITAIAIVVIVLSYMIYEKSTGKKLINFGKKMMAANTLVFANLITSNKDAFLNKVISVSDTIGLKNANHLMAVMYKESGLNPQAYNSNGGATGLIQFMPKTAVGLGTTTDALRKMSNVEQLDWVQKYFIEIKKWTHKELNTYEDLYLATFFPAALGKPDGYILETKTLHADTIAKANKIIDLNGNLEITVGEFKEYCRRHLGASVVAKL